MQSRRIKTGKHLFIMHDVFLPVRFSAIIAVCLVLLSGCRSVAPVKDESSLLKNRALLQRMGYAIQVGAFTRVDNATRLTEKLQQKGLEAYYFLHDSGLFKVRFGNFTSLTEAAGEAERFRRDGIIEDYYIVRPEEYPKLAGADSTGVRKGLVSSAKRFIGIPYKWGGTSDLSGFDCSGLAVAVYRLNGFSLPRTTVQQWETGIPVSVRQLAEGDLVFFSTRKNGSISHVGIYLGNGQFIHSPGKGKKIEIDSLSSEYYKRRYKGGRAFIV